MNRRVVFLVERTPWSDDQAYHFVRMALSLAADAEPVLIFAGAGAAMRHIAEPPEGCPDVAGQLRLYQEMVGPAYWTCWDRARPVATAAADALTYVPPEQAAALIRSGRAVFRC